MTDRCRITLLRTPKSLYVYEDNSRAVVKYPILSDGSFDTETLRVVMPDAIVSRGKFLFSNGINLYAMCETKKVQRLDDAFTVLADATYSSGQYPAAVQSGLFYGSSKPYLKDPNTFASSISNKFIDYNGGAITMTTTLMGYESGLTYPDELWVVVIVSTLPNVYHMAKVDFSGLVGDMFVSDWANSWSIDAVVTAGGRMAINADQTHMAVINGTNCQLLDLATGTLITDLTPTPAVTFTGVNRTMMAFAGPDLYVTAGDWTIYRIPDWATATNTDWEVVDSSTILSEVLDGMCIF